VDLPRIARQEKDKERENEKRGTGRRPDPVEAPTQGGAMG